MNEKEKKATVRITNIQRFCLHDGPGIRTTVFLKGCQLHCPWCANPETIDYSIQGYFDQKKGIRGVYGYDITLEELLEELIKDKGFYGASGGITFSGGEPLLQIQRYYPLLEELKTQGIHLAVETSLFAPEEGVRLAGKYFDIFMIDIKSLSEKFCSEVLGGSLDKYIQNFDSVLNSKKVLRVRFPLIPEYTLVTENIENICRFLKKRNINRIQLLIGHNLGENKYRNLGKEFKEIKEVDLDQAVQLFEEYDIAYEVLHF